MLINLEIRFVTDGCGFVLFHCLAVVLLLFVEQTNLEKGVRLPFLGEGVSQDRVLEIADGLLDLVSLCKDHS